MSDADLALADVHPDAARRIRPFFEALLQANASLIQSMHITGSAATAAYDPGYSDVNSVVVLHEMDLTFLERRPTSNRASPSCNRSTPKTS